MYLNFHAWLFFSVGHSQDAMEMLEEYLVGILPKYMRAYNT